MTRSVKAALAALAALAVNAALLLSVPSATAASSCGITWGSAAKAHAPNLTSPLISVHSGRHTCYDRLVLETSGKVDGYRVQYVPRIVQDGSGAVVPVAGGAKLLVVINAPAYNSRGQATFDPKNDNKVVDVAGYRTLRQVAWAGSFEGQTSLGVGVRARLPFRAFVVTGPGTHTRLVVDIAHTW